MQLSSEREKCKRARSIIQRLTKDFFLWLQFLFLRETMTHTQEFFFYFSLSKCHVGKYLSLSAHLRHFKKEKEEL